MTASPALISYLSELPGRCSICGYHVPSQSHRGDCPQRGASGRHLGLVAQEQATTDHPADAARVDSAIERHMASGRVFSANTMRSELAGVTGAVIGSRFGAFSRAGRIVHVGYERSTDPGTKGHEVKTWVRASP